MNFDPDTYHVSQDLGDEWQSHPSLEHIEGGRRVKNLAIPVSVLVPDPANVRLHPPGNLRGIRGSLQKYKQRQLVVVNRRNMIVEAGNARLEAGVALGWEFVAVLFVDDDPATATGYSIADNRTAETAQWDLPGLLQQLDSLKELDYEVPGIDDAFLNELEVLVKGASFTPLPEVPDEQAGKANEAGKIQIVLSNAGAVKEAAQAVKELLRANPSWGGKIVAAGAALASDLKKPEVEA